MKAGRTVAGTGLIVIGLLFLLDAAGTLDAGHLIGMWWPLLIVAIVAAHARNERRAGPGTVAAALVGLLLLGTTTGLLGGRAWSIVWPGLLILLGVGVVVAGRSGSKPSGPQPRYLVVLQSRVVQPETEAMTHASVTAILGAATLDLSTLRPAGPTTTVTATTVLGGIDVIVPEGWAVSITGIPLLGAWDDTTRRDLPASHRLEVRAFSFIGGVEVRHARRWS
jgi:hypothetical protein